ncbi:MAG: FAD-binding protein [Gemmatimonadota bacterium]|nr:MAG: FAD-binding protein [Gemmatimonadota bacterium]
MASPVLTKRTLRELAAIVGRDNILTQPGELLPYESDALTAYRATPAAVVFVSSTDEIRRVVSLLHEARIPFVPRGAGTGLSGGALADGAVVIQLSRLNHIIWVDAENRRARVQPGVISTQLNEAIASQGLMYAPDPSSQTVSTLGGNVAENSGGPHCLKYGVTTNHVVGLTVVMPNGAVVDLPGAGDPGYDLVGVFVGSEGTLGICGEIEVRLVPIPAAVETLLAHFNSIEAAGQAVSAIIAAGIVPAALEMIDQNTLKAVEASVYAAGFPTDVAASLIVELDGPRAGLGEQAAEVEALLKQHEAREVGRAETDADRLKFWKARKSAFGAMGRIGSDLLVQDATVPRSRLPEILARVGAVARKYDLTVTNVFHAGDGNLHPNIPFDRRDPGVLERVHAASREIMEACVAVGGTITGEHGVGIDKRKYMPLVFSEDDLETMRWVKQAFDPLGLCNPGKVLPDSLAADRLVAAGLSPSRGPGAGVSDDRGSVRTAAAKTNGVAAEIASQIGAAIIVDDPETFVIDDQPADVVAAPSTIAELAELMKLASRSGWAVVPAGRGKRLALGDPLARADLVVSTRRLNGSVDHQPQDLLATALAGTTLGQLNAALARAGQWWPIDPLGGGTIGATIASAATGPLAAAYGAPRDLVLGLTVVLADGRVVKAGGRVVKNVAGYDMVRLFTGSWGTLGLIAEAHLRLHPLPAADRSRIFKAGRIGDLLVLARSLVVRDVLPPAALEILAPKLAVAARLADDGWRLAARWLGSEAAVEDAIGRAEWSALRQGIRFDENDDVWRRLTSIETDLAPALTLRAAVPVRALAELVQEAVAFAPADPPVLLASPALGRLWIFISADQFGRQDERRWLLRIEKLRRSARESGGHVAVERAPVSLRAVLDPWGEAGPALELERALKERFDPGGVLKPGFFVGGL